MISILSFGFNSHGLLGMDKLLAYPGKIEAGRKIQSIDFYQPLGIYGNNPRFTLGAIYWLSYPGGFS